MPPLAPLGLGLSQISHMDVPPIATPPYTHQISFSISYKPAHIHDPQFDFHNGYKVVDQHDKSRRRFYAEYGIVEHVISVFGAKQGVNYLRLMGKAAFTSSGPHPSSDMVEIHQEIFPQIIEQIDMMGLLRENETAMDYMIRITVRAVRAVRAVGAVRAVRAVGAVRAVRAVGAGQSGQ